MLNELLGCPIGLDSSPALCSAGTCQRCQQMRKEGKIDCPMCNGVGKHGIPGEVCKWCDGKGHTRQPNGQS